MSQQISVEDAFPTFQKRCRELFEENLLLRAQVDVLERHVKELEDAAQQPADEPEHAPPARYQEVEPG
jgi:cell division septum initiation protein DivIVA